MNKIILIAALCSALVAMVACRPENRLDQNDVKEWYAKGKLIRQCIVDNKDKLNAVEEVPKCVLQAFNIDPAVAQQQFKDYMIKAGKPVLDYFVAAGAEAEAFFLEAKAKVSGYVAQIGPQLQAVGKKVSTWVSGIFGKLG